MCIDQHRLPVSVIAALSLSFFVGVGCGGEEAQDLAGEQSVTEQGYRVVEVKDGGEIRGRVLLAGTLDKPARFVEQELAPVCRGALDNNRLEVDSAGGVAWGVVRLVAVSEGKAFESDGPIVDQRDCRYAPHVVAARVGGAVPFRNSDPTPHNVRVEGPSGEVLMNVAQGKQGEIDTFEVESAGIMLVGCDYHPWMNAYVVGVENPYVAISGRDGAYSIDDVPPGEYDLHFWLNGFDPEPRFDNNGRLIRYRYSEPHEVVRRVKVEPNGTTTEDFLIGNEVR